MGTTVSRVLGPCPALQSTPSGALPAPKQGACSTFLPYLHRAGHLDLLPVAEPLACHVPMGHLAREDGVVTLPQPGVLQLLHHAHLVLCGTGAGCWDRADGQHLGGGRVPRGCTVDVQRGGGLAVACVAGVDPSVGQLAAAELQEAAPTHRVDAAVGPRPQLPAVLSRGQGVTGCREGCVSPPALPTAPARDEGAAVSLDRVVVGAHLEPLHLGGGTRQLALEGGDPRLWDPLIPRELQHGDGRL